MVRKHLKTPFFRPGRGFTLVELLVVVAIISILALISTPNMLEAQTRAKISRTANDMRVMALALESYAIDHNRYPQRADYPFTAPPPGSSGPLINRWPRFDTRWDDLKCLSTPVAYISSLHSHVDIFDRSSERHRALIDYFSPQYTSNFVDYFRPLGAGKADPYAYTTSTEWLLVSVGPDGYFGVYSDGRPGNFPPQGGAANSWFRIYDATNGTTSIGNILRFKGLQNPFTYLHEG